MLTKLFLIAISANLIIADKQNHDYQYVTNVIGNPGR